MEQLLKKLPIPICGLALGLAALGNLLVEYGAVLKAACGLASALILLLILIKAIRFPALIRENLQDSISASVSGTFPMSLMILSAYLAPFGKNLAASVWTLGIVLHILLLIWYSHKFIRVLKLRELFASCYIVYVGIGAAAITAPACGQRAAGCVFLYFSLAAFLILFIPITVRYIKYPKIPEPARPLFCIYAAPANLCLVGYLACVSEKSQFLAIILYGFGILCYLAAFICLLSCRKLPFYPSYAAFTFPFVISAVASSKMADLFFSTSRNSDFFVYAADIQTLIAACLIGYVLYGYIRFIFARSPV